MSNYPVYEATNECAMCKGSCCKHMPGHYSPSDFSDLSFEGLKAEIEKGNIAIDWWEATPKEYYLRARQFGENVVHGSWGGMCMNLTPQGCRLSWDERPLGCKTLKPREGWGRDCLNSYGKEDCKNEWKEYSDVLNRLAAHFGKQESPLGERMGSLLEMLDCMFGRCSDGLD